MSIPSQAAKWAAALALAYLLIAMVRSGTWMKWPAGLILLIGMAVVIAYAVLGIRFFMEGMMAKKKGKGGKKCGNYS